MPTGISQLKNGDRIKITWLPKVWNPQGSRIEGYGALEDNAYIGFEGVVRNLSSEGFEIIGDSGSLLCYDRRNNRMMKWELIMDQKKGDK